MTLPCGAVRPRVSPLLSQKPVDEILPDESAMAASDVRLTAAPGMFLLFHDFMIPSTIEASQSDRTPRRRKAFSIAIRSKSSELISTRVSHRLQKIATMFLGYSGNSLTNSYSTFHS